MIETDLLIDVHLVVGVDSHQDCTSVRLWKEGPNLSILCGFMGPLNVRKSGYSRRFCSSCSGL